jgi:hypothetical protein
LRNADPVTVVDRHIDHELRVRDGDGKVHSIQQSQLDFGYEFEIEPGKWLHESHPEVLSMLSEEYFEMKTQAQAEKPDDEGAEYIALLARILLRESPGR